MASAASQASWESSPEYAAWKANQHQVVAGSKSEAKSGEPGAAAAGDTKKPRKKRAAKTELVGETKAVAKQQKSKQVVEEGKEQFGAARKIREKGRKKNALDRIPSSNQPPKNDEENAIAQAQIKVFSEMLMKSLAAAATQLRKEEKEQGLPAMPENAPQVLVLEQRVDMKEDDEDEDEEDEENEYGVYDFSGIDLRPYRT